MQMRLTITIANNIGTILINHFRWRKSHHTNQYIQSQPKHNLGTILLRGNYLDSRLVPGPADDPSLGPVLAAIK